MADVQPVGSGQAALQYLAAYLCRPPLRESQIETCDPPALDSGATGDASVTFRYRENGGEQKRCTVSGEEFLRRVLQHVLPKGFQRVRHFGWRVGGAKKKWARILALLDWRAPLVPPPAPVPPPLCPVCRKPMLWISTLPRAP